jgi:hypothetical protein
VQPALPALLAQPGFYRLPHHYFMTHSISRSP